MIRTICVGEEDYRQLLNDLADLRRQYTELQSRMTEIVLQNELADLRRKNTELQSRMTEMMLQGKRT